MKTTIELFIYQKEKFIERAPLFQWFKNSKPHRSNNRPSYEEVDGSQEWWEDGCFVKAIYKVKEE